MKPKIVQPATDHAAPLPHDLGTERAILGTILRDNRAFDDVSGLKAEHFYNGLHGKAFTVIGKCIETGSVADANTIRHFFAKNTDVEVWDGLVGMPVADYITTLDQHAAPRGNVKSYVKTIRDLATRRAMIGIAEDLMTAAHDAPVTDPPVAHIEAAETALYALKHHGANSRPVVMIADAVAEGLANAYEAHKRGTGLSGLSTGIQGLDAVLGGLADGGLYIEAGRPGMGKTALAVNISYNVAKMGVPVGFLSLEMTAPEIGQRVLSSYSGIASWALRKGDIRSSSQWLHLEKAAKVQHGLPFYIDQSGGITLAQLVMKTRRMVSQYNLKLLVVDYLQLIQNKSKSGNRVQEVTEITVTLKALAKELGLPILALSQLSRGVEHRENKRPQMSDLRESGSIEQDADCVLFVFREHYYVERDRPDETSPTYAQWQADMRRTDGLAEVIVSKNRHGPTGTAELAFDAATITFQDKE